MSDDRCWLCHEDKQLCESHIIPRFVFRWLIETGGTPYLRNGASPNRRVQDGDKHKLYCFECEQLFSKVEAQAKTKIFEPATSSKSLTGWYGPWLSRFAASLAIRTVHSQQYRDIEFHDPKTVVKITNASENWRQFLLGKHKSPNHNSFYMLYPGYFDSFDAEDLPQNWNRFVHRAVERDLIFTDSGSFCATYVKLGPLIFLGKIIDQDNGLSWKRIACSEGQYGAPLPVRGILWNLLVDRARNMQNLLASISDTQAKKTEAEIASNPQRFLDSDQAKRMLDDMQQFGIATPETGKRPQ